MKYVNSEQFRKDEECIEAWATRLHGAYSKEYTYYLRDKFVTVGS